VAPAAGRLSCWSSRPRSPVGIVKGSVDAGGVARGGGRDDHASIHNFEAFIGRMATENCLWGAPRIHGELLKLGNIVSERTVSRFLPDRLTRRSQTWRTFLANHIGTLAFASTVTSSFATSDDDVDALVLPCRPVPPSRDGRYASNRWGLVDWPTSLRLTSLGWRVAQHQLRRRTRFSTGKDPPTSWAATRAGGLWVVVPYVEEIRLGERANTPPETISILNRSSPSASSGSRCALSDHPHGW
jgi:hypothetical protein